jgi:methionyl-tRNA formyltransferase
MDILFMGTPDFAEVSLRALVEHGEHVVCVVTQPDKPKGRGHKLAPPPVKEYALSKNIPVYQPEKLRDGELQEVLEKYHPDLIVVVAYGKILPSYILDSPKYGCINVHASLLPKYRGAAPIQWAILNGETKTGVTTMLMDKGLDTGDMLITKETKIGQYETSQELFDRLAVLGGEALLETVEKVKDGSIVRTAQEHDKHTYAPMITKEMARIDWTKPAREVSHWVCGMNSWPLAFTEYRGQTMKIIEATVADEDEEGQPGEILGFEKESGLKVKCGKGVLCVVKVQFAGSKKMRIEEYLLGHTIEIGTILK